jgi:hypothetical protein
MKRRWLTLVTLVLLLVLVTACGSSGDDEEPTAKILSPSDQHTMVLGETLIVESRSKDNKGISQVTLHVNGVQVDAYDVPEGEKSFRTEQTWLPPQVGNYTITVIAHDTQGQTSEPAAITISVGPAPAPTPTLPPPPTAAPEVTATAEQAPPPPQGCTYNSAFVEDITIPDDTELAPEAEFTKIWRLRNSGTCEWGPGVKLIFMDGEQMGGPAAVDVPATPAGTTADIEVPMKTPAQVGTYRGVWRLRNPEGQDFGDRPYVQIVVSPSITPSPIVTPTVTPPPKPDLDITLVSGNMHLVVGQPLALNVTIRNHGPGATDQPTPVRVVLGAGLQTETSVPTLPAGGEVVAEISHTFGEPAKLEILVSVDPDDIIVEEDETNNSEQIPVVINPPLYVTRTITATPGLRFDLDDNLDDEEHLDIEWRVVEGTVYVGVLNDAGVAALSGDAESVSYSVVEGLNWEPEQLALPDLAAGSMFGFRTSDDRVGYARVDEVLDQARTNARLTVVIWDWQ